MGKWEWKVVREEPLAISLLVDNKLVTRTKVFIDKGKWTCVIFSLFYKFISLDDPKEVIDFVNQKLNIEACYDVEACLFKISQNLTEIIAITTNDIESQLIHLRNNIVLRGKLLDTASRKKSMISAGKVDEFRNYLEKLARS